MYKGQTPKFLSFYQDALTANGIAFDVYDIDANGRVAPDDLGVLSHYDAVIWYTGDDIITRNPGMVPGTTTRLAYETMLNVRSFLNEGGGLLFTGKHAGLPSPATSSTRRSIGPATPTGRRTSPTGRTTAGRCTTTSSSTTWGPTSTWTVVAWTPRGTLRHQRRGHALEGLSWGLGGGGSANNQDNANTFVATSGILPESDFPQFTSWDAAKYARTGGPFDPHTGSFYVHSQIADVSYKRLTKTITVPGGGGRWTSGSPTTPRSTGTSSSSKPTRWGRRTGRRCRRERPHQPVHGRELPEGWHSSLDEIHPG